MIFGNWGVFIIYLIRSCIVTQIALVGGIPFSVVLPKVPESINANAMTSAELHAKLDKGYEDIDKGNVVDASDAFAKFREKH